MNNISINETLSGNSNFIVGKINTGDEQNILKFPNNLERPNSSYIRSAGTSENSELKMYDGLLSRSWQIASPDNEKNKKSPAIKVALVGLEIIDSESTATDLTEKQVEDIKIFYAKFIETTVAELIEKGHKNPQNRRQLTALLSDIMSILWDGNNFTYQKGGLLIQGLADTKKTLDCNSSCYFVADILNQFGVISKLVDVPGHVFLHCEAAGVSLYAETTEPFKVYKSEKKLNKAYPIVYGEYKFEGLNPLVYIACGKAEYWLEKYEDAIADCTKAIKLNENCIDAYKIRCCASYKLEDYECAIADCDKIIELDPDNAKIYRVRGMAYSQLGETENAEKDFETYSKLSDGQNK